MRSWLLAMAAVVGAVSACAGPESVAQRDAREAIARGDYRMKPPETMKDAEGRRYGLAYNATIETEQPFIAPANPLEIAMVALAENPSKESESAFETALLTSEVYILTSKEGVAAFKANPTKMTFSRLPTEVGRPYSMVLYSSRARLHQGMHNDTEWYWLSMPGRIALASSGGVPIAVNYGLRPPVYIEPEQVTRLLSQNRAAP
jgi:hypothetical protein